ncbi:DUF1206 domain-containing protein [Arthrobacter sp. SDTb3-6]|uniref:DUF1206 domain-containing protein n=1 Tax=Arthrobacter sp. SDTb3-6 TaxID=2713571 RepID=UPI00159DDD64|nr:DUF1206 domain-containing protein [Arthrobacter sp. SDTb3-6]NVN00630.1 DUF1206 domain-containing protein [Arthrobacter sp. SDTb3-6]
MSAGDVRRAARTAGNNPALTVVARAGYAASGLIHLLIGWVAIRVATHHGGEADQSGALAQLTKLPGGTLGLWATVVGLGALALWLLLQAALGIGTSSKKRWVRSVVSFGKALAYLALAGTALTFAVGGFSHASTSTRSASATILSLPGGEALLVAVGLATAGIGGYFIYKGARQKFREDIAVPDGHYKHAVVVLAVAGYVAKGIAVAIVGVLFIVAAATVDPRDASGLDGALKALVGLPFGAPVLGIVAAGLMAYGVYSIARARLALF